MTDIDFDELDRAVTSLMEGVKTAPETVEPVAEANTEKAVTLPESVAVTTTATSPELVISASEPRPAPKVTFSHRGQVLDAVHPATKSSLSLQPFERHTTTVTPPSSIIHDVAPPAVPVKPSTVPDIRTDTTAGALPLKEDISDPISTSSNDVTPTAASSALPVNAETEIVVNTQPADDYSPFIADAKVEKRPLGSLSSSSTPVPVSPSPTEPLASTQLEEKLPDELSADLVTIESNSAAATPPLEVAPIDTPELSTSVVVTPADTTTVDASTSHFAGLVSIPQQYQEAASSGEKDHTPIYDTSSYNQPLAHPAKKPRSWLWIIWILGLLLVGAVGAALLYHFGII